MTLCDLNGEDLVAYLNGELAGARLEYVQAHLRACAICQEKLHALRETKELLRSATPIVDDPLGRTETMRLIAQEARRSRHRSRTPVLTLTTVTLVFLLTLLAWPILPSQSGFRLAALVQRVVPDSATVQDPSTVLNSSQLPGIAVASPIGDGYRTAPSFPVVIPPRLPGDLVLTAFTQTQPGLADLRYLGPHELHLRLLESPETNASATVPPSYHRVVIASTEVLWHVNPMAPPISRAVWVRRGVQFELSVVDSSDSGFSLSDARQVVAQLIVAQDRAAP